MNRVPISKTKIETKLAIIRESLEALKEMGEMDKDSFLSDYKNFAVSEHYLRRALEAVFDIAGHIVSRYSFSPGRRPDSYKGLALALGEKGIIDKDFSKESLSQMAGYRNRMVHFYDELTAEEIYEIITSELGDIEKIAHAAVRVLENPEKFNLEIDE